jgi:hypothetical protein
MNNNYISFWKQQICRIAKKYPVQKDIVKIATKVHAVEDEFHFSFECPNYNNIGNNANNVLKNIFQIILQHNQKKIS